jgi:hypothetical protein
METSTICSVSRGVGLFGAGGSAGLRRRVRPLIVSELPREGIGEMFEEADRRDPERTRTAVALVDGQENQLTAVYDQALAHDPPSPSGQ